jgi:AcrR family transcriptional regulator
MTERSFIFGFGMKYGTETKERIERAAIRLFSKQGVPATSIREIAIEADVSKGAMYSHYVSKEDLAWSLFSRGWSEMGTELRRLARQHSSLRQQFRAMTRYVFETYEKDPEFVRFIYFSRHEHLRRVSPAVRANPYSVFKIAIVEAIARGEIPKQNAETATAMVAGMLIQMIDTRALGRIKQGLREYADLVADRCYRIVSA